MKRTILMGLFALSILINPSRAYSDGEVFDNDTRTTSTTVTRTQAPRPVTPPAPAAATTKTTTEVVASPSENQPEIDDGFDPGFYVGLNANYALTYEGDNDGDDDFFDDNQSSIYLNTKLGYDFHPNAALEFETGWQAMEIEVDDVELGNLHRVPLFANIVLKAPLGEDRKFVPYVSGGFGVMLYGSTEEDDVSEIDVDNAQVGFKAAVGSDYWFNRNMALNMETGYFFLPNPDVRINNVEREIGVDTWYIGAGLKFKFD